MPEDRSIFGKAADTVKETAKKTEKETSSVIGWLKNHVNMTTKLLSDFAESLRGTISPFAGVQTAAADMIKSLGLNGKTLMATTQSIIAENKKQQFSRQYNVSDSDIMRATEMMMKATGRNVGIDYVNKENPEDTTLNALLAGSRVMGSERVAEIVAGYDKLGKSMKTAADVTGKLYKEAGEYGINLGKYADNFTKNLHMAQMYNFRNGVNGLREMARRATEIRQDMKGIASFADRVNNVEGAIKAASQLQVLGGSFAAMANPLTMLNKSLTDVNGLAEMAASMTEGTAEYNSVTHEIEMDPVTKQLMKRAAEAMGMDPAALIDQAYAQARKAEISKQTAGIGNMSDEFKKLVENVGTIDEYGRAGVTTKNGEFKSLSEIAAMNADEQKKLQDELIEQNRSESEDIKEIAAHTLSIDDHVQGFLKQVLNTQASTATMPGVISGKSSYQLLVDTLMQKLTPESFAAAGKLDEQINSLVQNIINFTGSVVNDIVKPFSANNPEDFGKKWEEAYKNILGNFLGKDAAGTFGDIQTKLAEAVNSIGTKLEEYGLTAIQSLTGQEGKTTNLANGSVEQSKNTVALAAKDVTMQATNFSLNGIEGAQTRTVEGTEVNRATGTPQGSSTEGSGTVQKTADGFRHVLTTQITGGDEAQSMGSVVLAAKDVMLQATNFSLNGSDGVQMRQAFLGSDTTPAMASAKGNDSQYMDIIQAIANSLSGSNIITTSLNPDTNNYQTRIKFSESPSSVPNTDVVPTGNMTQAAYYQTGGGQGGNGARKIDVNASGTITLVSDNGNEIGKIGPDVFEKLLRELLNTDGFKKELAKQLGDSYSDIDKRYGLSSC